MKVVQDGFPFPCARHKLCALSLIDLFFSMAAVVRAWLQKFARRLGLSDLPLWREGGGETMVIFQPG